MVIEPKIGESAAVVMSWPEVERHTQPLSDAGQHPNVANVCDARGLGYNFAVSTAYTKGDQ